MWETASKVDRISLAIMPRDGGEIGADGEKERADLIVQIPRDRAAFLLLQGQQLLVQEALLLVQLREL